METITNSREAFALKLQCLYFIENRLVEALPKLEAAATDPDLKEGFRGHLEETEEHVKRIEEAFEILGEEPEETECEGIKGIIEDGEWVINEADVSIPEMKDAMLAGAARYAEHYEMAGYMSAVEEAKLLGLSEIASLLSKTLSEEESSDKELGKAIKKSMKAVLEKEEEKE